MQLTWKINWKFLSKHVENVKLVSKDNDKFLMKWSQCKYNSVTCCKKKSLKNSIGFIDSNKILKIAWNIDYINQK